jgi:plastocyanin
VLAIHTGDLDVLNSDGVLHNLHTYSKLNPQINKAQPKFKKEMTVSFEKPEVVKLTCDVHSWMQGWLVVLPSSYFALTDDHGVARIADVPAGRHTVEVWQERLGRRSKEVTVKPGSKVHVDFEYPTAG